MEDYLPRAEALDNPPAKTSNAKKTLTFWALLIMMCVALYYMFGAEPAHPRPTPPPPSDDGSSWWGSFPYGLLLLMFGFLWWQFRKGSLLNLRLEPGLLALADGQPARAAELFGEVARRYRTQPDYASSARFNRAYSLMRGGELQKAIDEMIAVERMPALMFASNVRIAAASNLALLFALRGDLERAQKWLEDAQRRFSKAGGDRLWLVAQQRVVASIVAARKGDYAEAAKLFDGAAARIEAALSVTTVRTAWLMRAFIAAKLGGPREPGAEPWLLMLRNARADEIGYLSKEWPELAAFVESSGLAR